MLHVRAVIMPSMKRQGWGPLAVAVVVMVSGCSHVVGDPSPGSLAGESISTSTSPKAEPSIPYSDPSTWTYAEKSFIQELRTGIPDIRSDFSEDTAVKYISFGHDACERIENGEDWDVIAVDLPSLPKESVFYVIGGANREFCPNARSGGQPPNPGELLESLLGD